MATKERDPHPLLIAWGMRLRRHREAAGLSIEELALRANVAPRQLIRVEHGKASASVLWIIQVTDALTIHPGELFTDRT